MYTLTGTSKLRLVLVLLYWYIPYSEVLVAYSRLHYRYRTRLPVLLVQQQTSKFKTKKTCVLAVGDFVREPSGYKIRTLYSRLSLVLQTTAGAAVAVHCTLCTVHWQHCSVLTARSRSKRVKGTVTVCANRYSTVCTTVLVQYYSGTNTVAVVLVPTVSAVSQLTVQTTE